MILIGFRDDKFHDFAWVSKIKIQVYDATQKKILFRILTALRSMFDWSIMFLQQLFDNYPSLSIEDFLTSCLTNVWLGIQNLVCAIKTHAV